MATNFFVWMGAWSYDGAQLIVNTFHGHPAG